MLGLWIPWVWAGVTIAAATLVAINLDLYRFFARHGDVPFTLGAVGLHVLYLLYSSLTFALIVGWDKVTRFFRGLAERGAV